MEITERENHTIHINASERKKRERQIARAGRIKKAADLRQAVLPHRVFDLHVHSHLVLVARIIKHYDFLVNDLGDSVEMQGVGKGVAEENEEV